MRNPFSRSVKMRDGFPVMPGSFPLVGHLPMVYRDLPGAFEAAKELGLGPMFFATLGLGQWVLLCSSPESIEILKSKAFTSKHLQEIAPLVAGQSLLSQDGPPHRHMRSAMNAPFSPRGLDAVTVGAMSAEVLSAMTDRWAAQRTVKVLPEIQSAALDVIFRIMGVTVGDLEPWRKQYRELILANLNVKLRFPGSPATRSEKAKKWLDARLIEIISEARRSPANDTLLSQLVHGKDDEGQPLTDPELLDNLRLLLLGGHETISSTMAWMAVRLAHHAELWDALVEEAKKGQGVPTKPSEARDFPVAESLFRETVRVHPAFGTMTRKCVEPFELHGRTIQPGTLVAVSLWSISHDESLFPEPHEFRPSRWQGRKSPPSAMEISQFGAGPHFCLGYHLAWLEGVQFAVALARSASSRGLRPALRDERSMEPIYLPTEHPSPKAIVDLR